MNDERSKPLRLIGLLSGIIFIATLVVWFIPSQLCSGSQNSLVVSLLWAGAVIAMGGVGYLCSRHTLSRIEQQRNQLEQQVQERTVELQDTLQELKRSYIEIERAHQEWEQAFDSIGDLVFLHDKQGAIQRANKAYITRTGANLSEILHKPYWEVFPRPEQCSEYDISKTDLPAGRDIRLTNGEVYRSRVYTVTNRDGTFRYALHILTDITERKKLDSKLNLLLQAVEYSNASVIITDTSGKIQFVNRRFEQVTGYTRNEVYGKNPSILKSGETPAETYKSMWDTISEGKEWQGEFHNRKKDGTLFWESATITPIRDDSDKITGYMAVKEDINLQKLTQEAMRRSQKMQALGHLTGGIAHDFNNLLGIIIGNLDFLRRLVCDDERALNRVETASKATLRGAALTKQLLSFSSRQGMTREATDVNRIIHEMGDLLARSLNPEVVLETHLNASLWITEIDPGELEDALLNLALNAKAAMPNGGNLIITTGNVHLDEYYAHFQADAQPGDYVELTIADNGCGMTQEVQEHAFEPFFSTRPKGEGTGLGLSMVYGFVQRAGGHATIQSAPGSGTRIQLYLPRSQQTTESAGMRSISRVSTPAGKESILVVDDEQELMELTVEFLTEAGYQVITATNGVEAMESLAQHPEIDLLFSDVLMPGGMNGYDLVVQAQKKYPALRVLLTSGFTDNTVLSDVKRNLSTDILNKPYRKEELLQRIKRILDH
ncbi:MAG: PAS domain S-box protein [Gammaproteobacteria bacterium]|nr:PAS domain S-box protein [Gammaproteobacteria bacterium]